ncbi:MAG: amidohydrolase [Bacteroidota bacterium]
MQDLTVSLIQADTFWHDPDANRAMFEEFIWSIETDTDLIILPEMFTTGFTMEASVVSEPDNGPTFRWMKNLAQQLNSVITGSIIVKSNQGYFNRLIWMEPDGSYQSYDKRHLFRFAQEDETYSAGKDKLIKELKGWKVNPQICYDLRFPVWSKNRYEEKAGFNYDLLLFVANWPAARVSAWDSLLRARAIENSAYVIGVNRVGKDGKDISYNGHSGVYDPKGGEKVFLDNEITTKTITLSKKELDSYRHKFQVHKDWDSFDLRN